MAGKFVFALICGLCAVSFVSPALADGNVVAKVSGVPITQFEVNRQIDKVMPFRVSFHGQMSQEKKDALQTEAVDALIERAYKVCYAHENNILVDSDQVDTALAKIRANYPTDEAFGLAVADEGVNGLRASLGRQLLADRVEAEVVESKVKVTDAEVETYYNERKQMFLMPQQFRASHILIKVDPASNQEERAALKAKADGLLKQAKSGEDFFNLAYYNSDDRTKFVGGDLGLFHEGQTAKPFEDALKKMELGEISDLVETRWGYHIIKLVERNEPRQMSFSDIKLKVRSQLEKVQRDTYYQQMIASAKAKCPLVMTGE